MHDLAAARATVIDSKSSVKLFASAAGGAAEVASAAVGCMLLALVYTGHQVSGAHYNPAITLRYGWAYVRQCMIEPFQITLSRV